MCSRDDYHIPVTDSKSDVTELVDKENKIALAVQKQQVVYDCTQQQLEDLESSLRDFTA